MLEVFLRKKIVVLFKFPPPHGKMTADTYERLILKNVCDTFKKNVICTLLYFTGK